jgi:hypothetical protein
LCLPTKGANGKITIGSSVIQNQPQQHTIMEDSTFRLPPSAGAKQYNAFLFGNIERIGCMFFGTDVCPLII